MLHVHVYVHVQICRNAGMPDCPASGQAGTGLKKTMLEQVQCRTKLSQSGMFLVRYRTKIRDAGIPMPALVSSMPMPCHVNKSTFNANTEGLQNKIFDSHDFSA